MEKSANFDFTTNFGVICGITIDLVVGLGLPTTAEGKQNDDIYWRVIIATPLLLIFIQLILWFGFFKLESPKYCFSVGEID